MGGNLPTSTVPTLPRTKHSVYSQAIPFLLALLVALLVAMPLASAYSGRLQGTFVGAQGEPEKNKGDEEVVIIAHPGVTTSTLSRAEMQNMLLGKSTKWGNGRMVVLANLKSGRLHERFTKEYAGKTTSQFKIYWKKRVFTGKGKTPKTLGTEEKLLDYVASTPGAIGYISKKTADDKKIMNDPRTKKSRVRIITRK